MDQPALKSKIYHSLRPPFFLPPITTPLSITSYIFTFLHHHPPTSTAVALLVLDTTTHRRILHSQLQSRVKSLASSLHHEFGLSRGDAAFILSTNSSQIPILYISLFLQFTYLNLTRLRFSTRRGLPDTLKEIDEQDSVCDLVYGAFLPRLWVSAVFQGGGFGWDPGDGSIWN